VTRSVNDDVAATRRPKRDLCCVNRDVLFLLFEQCIQHEREFKFHPFSRAGFPDLVDLAFGKRSGVMQNPPDERRFAMINVPDENDA
jgi:hypothetical protein